MFAGPSCKQMKILEMIMKNRMITSLMAVIALSGVGSVFVDAATTSSAGAWPTSGNVTLTGNVKTWALTGSPLVNNLWVKDSDGEQGWASVWGMHSGHTGQLGSYSFNFTRIPFGNSTVYYTLYTSRGSFSGQFGLSRPLIGSNAVVDICQTGYPFGC